MEIMKRVGKIAVSLSLENTFQCGHSQCGWAAELAVFSRRWGRTKLVLLQDLRKDLPPAHPDIPKDRGAGATTCPCISLIGD